MLLRKTYGIDLGSSTIKVYSFLKNKSYMEKNMEASRERRIIAVGNEAYEMFEKSPVDIAEFSDDIWYDCKSGTPGDRIIQYDEKNR